ncbi:MAG: hypothetical protein WEF50_08510 [Myxococcota bacterium]
MQVGRCLRALGASVWLASASACAFGRGDYVMLNPGTSYPPRSTAAPVVLTVGDWNGPYEELGVILVSGYMRAGYDSLNAKLRERAREAGADGVIFVRYGTANVLSFFAIFVSIPWDVLTAEGVAVRSKKP